MKSIIIIFSGYNQRAIIAFLRTLKENGLDHYAIIASSDKDMIFRTVYSDKVFYTRRNIYLDLQEISNAIDFIRNRTNAEKAFIAPSTEALNRFILKYRTTFEEHNCIIPLVEEKLYEQISDKESFWKLCKNSGLVVPKEVLIGSEYKEPVVAKPKKYFSPKGSVLSPVLIQTEEEFKLFMNEYDIDDFTYQEFVTGESYYLLYYFARNGDSYCFSQKNIAQQLGGKSIVAACCAVLHEGNGIAVQYDEFFKKINFYGLVMVELRRKNNEYYMIEANPRFWGPSQLFCDSGFNFFEFFLYDYGFLNVLEERRPDLETKYFWRGGIKENGGQNGDCVWYGEGKNFFGENKKAFLQSDIYMRPDTMKIYYDEEKSQ